MNKITILLSMSVLAVNGQTLQSHSSALESDLEQEYVEKSTSSQDVDTLLTNSGQMSVYNQYQLFAPTTFSPVKANQQLCLNETAQDAESEEIDAALMNLYLNRPDLVVITENQLKEANAVKEDIVAPIRHDVDLVAQVAPVPQEVDDAPIDVVVEKPNFWTIKGDYYLQFLQNYISGNWYKGGESNYAMVASGTIEANYDNKGKWKWDNKLEAKLGFQTSKSDLYHDLKTSEDLLRLNSKVGLQATKNWYYTFSVLAQTQFMRGYKNNKPDVFSDFGSPFVLNVSLGMSYNVNWLDKKLTGTIQLSPFSYNMIYVNRLALASANGVEEGKHVKHDFGSVATIDLNWKFNDNISWKNRLYGFTSFRRALIEWENEFTFKLSKYISSKLFIYPRFDDAVGASKRDDDLGYWQFKEYFSLGFSYTF